MTDYRDELFDVLVTAPVNQPERTDLRASSSRATRNTLKPAWAKVPRASSILWRRRPRIASVTGKTPLKDVPGSHHPGAHHREGEADAHIPEARLHDYQPAHAVLALGILATTVRRAVEQREASIIIPAIDQLAEQKIQAFGPLPVDEFFGNDISVERVRRHHGHVS